MVSNRILIPGLVLVCALLCAGVATIGAAVLAPAAIPALANNLLARPTDSSVPLPKGAPAVGQVAPDFQLPGIDKQTVSLGALKGKVVVVNFWATWCGPCTEEMPNLEKAYQQHKTDPLVILGVNQEETPDHVAGYADLYRLHFPLVMDQDGHVSALYRVQALPTTYFVDKTGTIRQTHIGEMSFDYMETQIQSLLR